MNSITRNQLLGSAAILATSLFALAAPAAAQQVAASDGFNGALETVVVTGTAFDADVAPARDPGEPVGRVLAEARREELGGPRFQIAEALEPGPAQRHRLLGIELERLDGEISHKPLP